jgi:hypothetical protein
VRRRRGNGSMAPWNWTGSSRPLDPCPLAVPKQELALSEKGEAGGRVFRSSLCSG